MLYKGPTTCFIKIFKYIALKIKVEMFQRFE